MSVYTRPGFEVAHEHSIFGPGPSSDIIAGKPKGGGESSLTTSLQPQAAQSLCTLGKRSSDAVQVAQALEFFDVGHPAAFPTAMNWISGDKPPDTDSTPIPASCKDNHRVRLHNQMYKLGRNGHWHHLPRSSSCHPRVIETS
ncbi:hypothetical protein ACFIOY_18805 [Bradyrhizobium sp. TZ2]